MIEKLELADNYDIKGDVCVLIVDLLLRAAFLRP